MSTMFWVIGGKFSSLNFHRLVDGTQQVRGPFATRPDAEESWRTLSESHRHEADMRFTIVSEQVRATAQVA